METRNIPSKIIYARALGAFRRLLSQYGLSQVDEDVPLNILLEGLAAHVSESDANVCMILAKAVAETPENNIPGNALACHILSDDELKGVREAEYAFIHYRNNLGEVLISSTSLSDEAHAAYAKYLRKRRITFISLAAVVVAIIAFAVIYNLPYFVEQRLWSKAQSGNFFEIKNYLEEFPQGSHAEEARYLLIEATMESEEYSLALEYINDYFKSDHQGKFRSKVETAFIKIFNHGIEAYRKDSQKYNTTVDADFMIALLEYMKTSHLNTVYIKYSYNLEMKDFSEYPKSAQEDMINVIKYEWPSVPEAILSEIKSGKDKISPDDLSNWLSDFTDSLNSSLINMVGFPLISFKPADKDMPEKAPVINIDFTIRNQEFAKFGKTYPELWEFGKENLIDKSFGTNSHRGVSYLYIGIAADFGASCKLPNGADSFEVSKKGVVCSENVRSESIDHIYFKSFKNLAIPFLNSTRDALGLATPPL